MTRQVLSPEGQKAQAEASAVLKKCIKLARSGRVILGSKELRAGLHKWLKKGKNRGQAGETAFRHAAGILLEACVEFQIPPPVDLSAAIALLLNTKSEGIGDEWALVAFAAQYSPVKSVPTGKLARAGRVNIETGKPLPALIDLNTARSRKRSAEFRRAAEEAKSLGSAQSRAHWKLARDFAKQEAAEFGKLLEVVRTAARKAAPPKAVP